MKEFDLAIVGGGPAGLFCGIAAAGNMRVLVLSDPRDSAHSTQSKTLEAVPSTLLALLLQFGIHPADIGIDHLYTNREIAWSTTTPHFVPAARMALIERPRLEMALLARLRSFSSAEIRPAVRHEERTLADPSAATVVDATGRRAFTASQIERAPLRWVAHLWSFDKPAQDDSGTGLKLAALEGGYAYRLSSSSFATIGLVGPAYKGISGVCDLRTILAEAKAQWLLSGVDLASARMQGSRIASLQWSVHRGASGSILSIGDAALARDAMSSQGLAVSISDALYAVAATRDKGGADLLTTRHVEQRTAHIKHLIGTIKDCAFRNSAVWRDYLAWLLERSPGLARKVALRDGRIATVAL